MDPFPRTFVTENKLKLTIDLTRPQEADEICKFLQEHFLTVSPSCYLIKNRIDNVRLKEFISPFLDKSVSLTVRDSNGTLVAVRMNNLVTRSVNPTNPGTLFNEKELIELLFEALERDIDLFEKYKTDTIFSLEMMAVDQSYGRLGLATTLVTISFELARFYGAGVVQMHAANDYAARVASKFGMEALKTIDYSTLEFNGSRPLANVKDLLDQHPVARLMAGPPIIPYKN